MGNYVITIARGFGSGGKSIAQDLSKLLGIPWYENEILDMASDASGINRALFHDTDEKVRGNHFIKMLKGIPHKDVVSPNEKDFISDINLFNLQAQIIRSLALTQSCIFVGKCADHVLEYYDNVYRIYVDAPREACIKSVVEKMYVSEAKANQLIQKTDKYRADYYKYYTGKEWTNPTNYDLFINSDRVGRDKCAELIKKYVEFQLGETLGTASEKE
ncbi:cytidylate kinase-like family protein [Chakrabartyella piscis]|uniref:cytidylate kinase-like family protein n=1 Tax=Chakrabartyella piscis TaxID=2918914 RepID=UPI002958CE77|nr:cytidylate kinase-like family protein [Chakrabartyella piscis]